jgi:DHA3 family tetracycline resistance protein-like MFS transporter
VQHSHEGLDRSGGFSRVRLLAPLRHRDFRLLWGGMCVSLLGDGIFLVAMAWQVYALSDAPTAMSMVGIAMTVPTIALLLLGGAISDRRDRRRIMVAADLLRAGAVGTMALLAITGTLELWHMIVLVAFYGAGAAFFGPAFDALVPDVLPCKDLAQANSLEQVIRPVAHRLAGPAIGGLLVETAGLGAAFAVNAASFVACAGAALALRARPRAQCLPSAGLGADIGAGLRYVRSHVWLWGTFASAAVAYLLFMGPTEVLVTFIVKNELGASAADLGAVFAAGGIGSVLVAVGMGQGGLPRRDITFMYGAWALATLAVAGYGLAGAVWQLMLASLLFNALETAGTIVWATAKQRHIPPLLLGRVSSLDWLISIGLLPLSFALTGPVSGAVGVRETMVGAAVLGAIVTIGALFLPGIRAVEGREQPAWETDAGPPAGARASVAAAR